jgi:hypothetical protein
MNAALAELLHNSLVWRGDQLAPTAGVVPSGFPTSTGNCRRRVAAR